MPQRGPSRRRLRAVAAAAAVALLGATVPAAHGAALDDVEPLIHYSFDQVPSGTTIVDESGNGYDAVLHRSGAAVEDGVLSLPGGSANSAPYVQVPTTGLEIGRASCSGCGS